MRFLTLVFFLAATVLSSAQVESPYIQNFTNKVYGKNSNPEIYAVVQDNENVILAGTSNGVLVYNGSSWKFVGVRNGSHVTALSKTSDGRIMVGGLAEFGELKKNAKGAYVYRSLSQKDQLNETVWRVHSIGNETFFQTESAVYVYEGNKRRQVLKAQTSFHLSFELNGRFYVRQRQKGLFVYKDHGLKIIDASGKMKNEGLFALFKSGASRKYFFRDDFSANPIESSIYGGIRLKDGNYALNTLSDGVYILDKNFKPLYHYNQSNGLTDNDVKQVYQGSDGNLWLATNNGLSYIEYRTDLDFYSDIHGLEGDVQDVFRQSADALYIATTKGIYLKSGGKLQKLNINFPSWELYSHNGQLYAATSGGIVLISGNSVSLKKVGNYNNLCFFQGNFVLSGGNGIEFCTPQFGRVSSYDLPLNRTLKMLGDPARKELWIGTIGVGLVRIKADLSMEIYESTIDGLNTAWIKPLLTADKEIVFATKDGLQRFIYEEEVRQSLPDSLKNDPNYSRGIFEPFGTADEISELFVFRQTRMAVILNEIKITKDKSLYNSPYSFLDFGRINQVKVIGKDLYICTSDGLTIISDHLKPYKSNFKLSFEQILYKEHPLALNAAPELDFYKNTLVFKLKAPSFFHSSQVKFRYKMSGEQDSWSTLSGSRTINFSKLYEGSYTIYIQAENSLGEQSNILEYTFTITPPWYRTSFAYLLYILILILSFWFAIKVSRRRLEQKNKELENIVQERTQEVVRQKHEIEEKHKEITDSINYAERIQTALMMSDEHWDALAEDHFILFRPRDVVSGDFYWAYQNENYAVWTAADCTGHGVPGAFMSMLGIGFLNEIVIEGKNFSPAQILNQLRSKIIKALQQKGSSEERKDGMDIALCCWDKKNNTVRFSGANNPLILVTANEEKAKNFGDEKMMAHNGRFLVTISADKMPVGKYVNDERSFTETEFTLDPGDVIFSFSDGFPDQFGGADGKKYMIKRFKTFLLMQQTQNMEELKALLVKEFEQWLKEGNAEQIDDVCVVGVRIT
ncbi:MAG: Response regulator containing a CheY-like receiver domain and a domain protein [Crocinitomicaceae bacterium]|jgi:serine phosphatase RsbU (regulator of sigma subunit)|nr:Response regulator containing a CheY-like receiver domain and a domain protein [Crocinitomicaceae bacterium]